MSVSKGASPQSVSVATRTNIIGFQTGNETFGGSDTTPVSLSSLAHRLQVPRCEACRWTPDSCSTKHQKHLNHLKHELPPKDLKRVIRVASWFKSVSFWRRLNFHTNFVSSVWNKNTRIREGPKLAAHPWLWRHRPRLPLPDCDKLSETDRKSQRRHLQSKGQIYCESCTK